MKSKRRLAAKLLKQSPKKVKFVADALEDIKKAITRSDLRGLIAVKKIVKGKDNEQSRARARKSMAQKRKGRKKGRGKKKGSRHSIVSRKKKWIVKVRAQRLFLKELKNNGLISSKTYQTLYGKIKGGYFRNKRHIKLYLTEYRLIETKEKSNVKERRDY